MATCCGKEVKEREQIGYIYVLFVGLNGFIVL